MADSEKIAADAVAASREIATRAQEAGDQTRANAYYNLELQALASHEELVAAPASPDGSVGAVSFEMSESVLSALGPCAGDDPETAAYLRGEVAKLEARWPGRAMADNIALAKSAFDLLTPEEQEHVSDTPAWLIVGAAVGRLLQSQTARPPQAKGVKSMSTGEDYALALRDFDARIAEAQSEGNSGLANTIYQEQMRFIAQTKGNAPIVNGRRTA